MCYSKICVCSVPAYVVQSCESDFNDSHEKFSYVWNGANWINNIPRKTQLALLSYFLIIEFLCVQTVLSEL